MDYSLQGYFLRPYNVGSGDSISISDLAQMIKTSVAPDISVEFARKPKPDYAPSRYVPSVSRASVELGLREQITLNDAIERTKTGFNHH